MQLPKRVATQYRCLVERLTDSFRASRLLGLSREAITGAGGLPVKRPSHNSSGPITARMRFAK